MKCTMTVDKESCVGAQTVVSAEALPVGEANLVSRVNIYSGKNKTPTLSDGKPSK